MRLNSATKHGHQDTGNDHGYQEMYLLQTVMDSLQEPFYVINASDFSIVGMNSAARLFYGEVGSTCYAITKKEQRACTGRTYPCPVQEVLRTGKPFTGEEIHVDRHGHQWIIEIRAHPVFDDRGKVVHIIEHCVDISEHERAEKELYDREQMYRALFERTSDAVFIINLDLSHIEVNERAAEMLGYTVDELVNMPAENIVASREYPDSQYVAIRLQEGKVVPIYERIFRKKDGTEFPVEINAALVTDTHGNPLHYQSVVRDITRRKELEEQLFSINKQLARRTGEVLAEKCRVETIIESVPDGILYLDASGQVTLVNGPFQALYKQLSGDNIANGCILFELQDNALTRVIREVFSSGTAKQLTVELETGRYLQLFTSITQVPGQPPSGFLFVTRDITPFIELDQMRKDFVSNVSHELRTPIANINLSLQNVLKYGNRLRENQKNDLVERAARNASILSQMIEDLLLVSRIEAGKVKLQWKKYSPLEILQNILDLMEPRLLTKHITVTVDVDPAVQLTGDPKRIEQVFRVLVDNAIKYSGEKTVITITAGNGHSTLFNTGNKGELVLYFRDQGRGIPAKDIPNLFTRFFRSDNVKDLKGTGLGLNIARELILLHGGDIQVTSELGKGSTFTVRLPVSNISVVDR